MFIQPFHDEKLKSSCTSIDMSKLGTHLKKKFSFQLFQMLKFNKQPQR